MTVKDLKRALEGVPDTALVMALYAKGPEEADEIRYRTASGLWVEADGIGAGEATAILVE